MQHNIPLMRNVYESANRNLDQTRWRNCLAGITIRQHGYYGLLENRGAADAVQVLDFRSGAVRWTDEVAAELLGLIPDEADFAFRTATNRQAIDWLEDILVAHDMRDFDLLATGFDESEYPIGEVRG
jgi:hypothetical protein